MVVSSNWVKPLQGNILVLVQLKELMNTKVVYACHINK